MQVRNGCYNVRAYGAQGDGQTQDAPAITAAIRACHAGHGGTVTVPAGVYLCAPFELLSNVTLHLDAGATIRSSARLEDYPVEPAPDSMESNRAGLITARGATNVAIQGRGTIDGSGPAFIESDRVKPGLDWDPRFVRQGERFMSAEFGTEESSRAHRERPGNLVRFLDCNRVAIRDVTICDSPTWTIHLHGCRNVDIGDVWIHSHGSGRRVPNDDGIDVWNCMGVRIHGCQIETGDDCIALFGGENIVVTGCTLSAKSAGIRVGYLGAPIRNCVFSDLVIHDAHRGIGVFVRGANSIENLLFSNIVIRARHVTGHWWGAAEPIHVSAIALERDAPLGSIANVCFRNITAEAESGIVIYGSESNPIRDLTLESVRLRIRRGPLAETYGGNLDLRGTADPATSLCGRDLAGLYARETDRLTLRNLDLNWEEDLPAYFSHGVECERFRDLEIDGFRGRQAQAGSGTAAVLLRDGARARLRNCRATDGNRLFLSQQQVTGLDVGND